MREGGCPGRRALSRRDVAFKFVETPLGEPGAHEIETAGDACKQVVEVVGQPPRELTDRLHFLSLEERLLGLLKVELRLASFRQVPGHLGEADRTALVVTDRVYDDVGPEAGSVLPQTPPLSVETALCGRGLQGSPWNASRHILRRVESGEVLADDFVGGVALDLLGAGVPVRHDALGIQHEDGVVGDPLHEQPETALALQCGEHRFALCGDVTRDLREADELSVGSDRIDDDHGPETAAILAKPPALGLKAAILARRLQCLLRQARLAILRRVEAREMLADDLSRCVELDPLGPGVPARHAPLGVKHIDSVVDDRLDEAFVRGRAQLAMRVDSIRQAASDLPVAKSAEGRAANVSACRQFRGDLSCAQSGPFD